MSSRSTKERSNRWFQPKEGIAREVITADIQRYLGRDAVVRPGVDNNGQDGYWITAYRNLTTEMVRDLQQDSQRWRAEQQGSRLSRGDYTDSQTHASRQHWGPTETPAPTMNSQYAPPPPAQDPYGGRDPYAQQPVRTAQGYNAQPGYGQQQPGYAPAPNYGPSQSGYQDTFQSPQSAYSQASYASSTAAPYSTGSSNYPNASPQHQQFGAQPGYVTSTTPQSFDAAKQVPRTATYQQVPQDQRAAAATVDPYAAQRQYYQQGAPANTSMDYVPTGHATVPPQSSSSQYYSSDPYRGASAVSEQPSSKRSRHDERHSSSHRNRR